MLLFSQRQLFAATCWPERWSFIKDRQSDATLRDRTHPSGFQRTGGEGARMHFDWLDYQRIVMGFIQTRRSSRGRRRRSGTEWGRGVWHRAVCPSRESTWRVVKDSMPVDTTAPLGGMELQQAIGSGASLGPRLWHHKEALMTSSCTRTSHEPWLSKSATQGII